MLYNQELINLGTPNPDVLSRVNTIVSSIKEDFKKETDFDALKIAYKTDDLKDIIEFGDFIKNNFRHTVVMGIGGSSLGAKTLIALKNNPNITILESIDYETVKDTFDNLDLQNTAFLTVSKSGKTIECISQTLLILKIVEEKLGKDAIKKHFFFLTEDKESPLTNLAKEFDIKTFPHDKKIGGRFSYLSNVGLIPAHIAGLNIAEIRNGAKDTLEYVFNNSDNFISQICALQYEFYNNNICESVVMPYVDKLKFLTEWYRQIWAESLGKNGYGVTPINAMGTVDQHSQLQLYIDGPKNKFYTFILREKSEKSLKITKSYNDGFNYLLGMSLDDISEIEFDTTIEILEKRGLPVRVITFKDINERSLSQLLMQYMLETIIVGRLNNINPFGQPGVEERKILAKERFVNR